MIEIRSNIKGNYKGFVYFDNLQDCVEALEIIKKKILTAGIKTKIIEIKHGCSEFYEKFPDYKNINFKGKQKINYNENWKKYEEIIDKKTIIKNRIHVGSTLNMFTLSDFFILRNWLVYAKFLGDTSFQKIDLKKSKNNFFNNILKNQYEFRKKELR